MPSSSLHRALSLALLLALAAVRVSADPYVGYFYPAVLRAGETNRVLVGGQQLWNLQGCFTAEGDVAFVKAEQVPNFSPPPGDQRRHLLKWLANIARGERAEPPVDPKARVDEWRSNRWWRALGTLDAEQLALVEHFLHEPRNPLQMSPSLRQQVFVTLYVPPRAPGGARLLRLFNRQGLSPPRPVWITERPRVREPLYVPPVRPAPACPVARAPAILNGQILPGQEDVFAVALHANVPVVFRTLARELQPYVGDAVPGFFNPVLTLRDPAARTVAFADDDAHRPDPVLAYTPAADGRYTLAVRDNLYRGREDFVYAIDVREGDTHPASWSPCGFYPAPRAEEGAAYLDATGALTATHRAGEHVLEMPCAGPCAVEVFARRLGAPLDARVSVVDGAGRVCAAFTDVTNALHVGSVIQEECDPRGVVTLAPGRYRVRVEGETQGAAGAGPYRVRVAPARPSFAVYARTSGFALSAGAYARVRLDVVRENGFDGPLTVKGDGTLRLFNATIPAGTNRWSVTFQPQDKAPALRAFALWAEGEVRGVATRCEVIPCDVCNQAFAWDHHLPAGTFALKVFPAPKKPPAKRKR